MGREPALLAAAAYAYVPYRFKEAFVQGDYPQFLALALLPLVFWAFYKIIVTRKPRYIVVGACLYGTLVLSHNITAMQWREEKSPMEKRGGIPHDTA